MSPVNSTIANETSPSISNTFLREKYNLTEEYAKNHPEDFAKILSAVRCTEETLQIMDRLEQAQKEVSNGMARLREGSEVILARLDNIIEVEKKNTQALQNLANSSSEMKEMTSNIANFAKRFFNPVRNGFYFLTGHREPAAVLPREDQLAIKDNPENTIPNTDPTNQTSGDIKKKITSLLIFFAVSGGLYFLPAGEQRS
ncbi:hypothetical protein [Candidatus Rhabdochlamydia sp. T3358]|uniref:hypothetical protein n=1 Tax=Candidatus Rhabdochlamydia sp. T3358 TaxID=2099795 RepID=UPI0010B47032|nr:hypothetical protein [Candidatus Rhabdochlamydia sp. T3358]VHO00778.1 hypothetical protein RHT_00174 [Candidatus Rhabdochlamydia sp. T3358]